MMTQRVRVLMAVAALAAALLPAAPAQADPQSPVDLVVASSERSTPWSNPDAGIIRARRVEVHPEVLDRSVAANDRIRIELFGDTVVILDVTRFSGRSGGPFTWVGTAEGLPGSRAILIGDGDGLAGSLLIGGRVFEIAGGIGGHVVSEIERTPSRDTHVIATGERYLGGGDVRAKGRTAVIDVTIAYTERAKEKAGGKHAVEALSTLAIESMNETLLASGVDVSFRLVKNGQIDFYETWDVWQDLDDIAYSNAAWPLKSWRDEYGSDVAMVFTGRDYGAATEMPGHFSVVGIGDDDGFSSINRVVELAVRAWGHNLGAGSEDDCGIYEDSCAYDQPDGLFHTIMTEGDDCDGCIAAPVFSNPNIEFSWLDSGFFGTDLYAGPFTLAPKDPSPLPTGVTGKSNNAGTIALFAPIAAEWRDTKVRGATCGGLLVTWEGTSGDDEFFGTNGKDVVLAGKGNDVIRGGAGSDVICGSAGDDKLIGGKGDDFLYGGGGKDLLKGVAGADFLDGEGSRDKLYGGAGDDVLRGGHADDKLVGGQGDDSAHGGPGNDELQGNAGNDRLAGGRGRDDLAGGPGQDWLQLNPGEAYRAE